MTIKRRQNDIFVVPGQPVIRPYNAIANGDQPAIEALSLTLPRVNTIKLTMKIE